MKCHGGGRLVAKVQSYGSLAARCCNVKQRRGGVDLRPSLVVVVAVAMGVVAWLQGAAIVEVLAPVELRAVPDVVAAALVDLESAVGPAPGRMALWSEAAPSG